MGIIKDNVKKQGWFLKYLDCWLPSLQISGTIQQRKLLRL